MEAKRIERSISELETSVEPPEFPAIPRSLSNKIEIVDGSRTAIYTAEIKIREESYYYGIITGYISLGRYDLLVNAKTERKLVSIFPWKVEMKQVPYTEEKLVWNYLTPNYCTIFNSDKPDPEYRRTLAEGILGKYKIKVSPELIALAFDPIEQQIEEWCKKYNDIGKKREEMMTIKRGKNGW